MADIKFTKTSPLAAYSVAIDVTPEEAEALGLQVVENDEFGFPTAWGRYDEPDE